MTPDTAIDQHLREFLEKSNFASTGGVITDLDGTAVHEDRGRIYIPEPVEFGLKQLHGAGRQFILNSLRFPLSVMRTFGKEWYSVSNSPIPLVSLNGSLLGRVNKNAEGELVFEKIEAFPLTRTEIEEVLKGVGGLIENGIKDILVFYYPRDWRMGEIIWTPVPENVLHIKEKYVSASAVTAVELAKLHDQLASEEICMIFLLLDVPEDQLMAYQHTKRTNFFTHKGVDKLFGAQKISAHFSIDLAQSIGAGDTELDRFLGGGPGDRGRQWRCYVQGPLADDQTSRRVPAWQPVVSAGRAAAREELMPTAQPMVEISASRARAMARKIISHHFGAPPQRLVGQAGGLSNHVFMVKHKEGDLVIRLSSDSAKINAYIKEQWAVAKARELKVPTPEILEVGNQVIPFPYMVSRRTEGRETTFHPKRLDILRELGSIAARINTVRTTGFGTTFDWSNNQLSLNDSWEEFLTKELEIENRLKILSKRNMLSRPQIKKLLGILRAAGKKRIRPSLNHGDLRLKNVLVNKEGAIKAVIDWEDCISSLPVWELSVAMHDLSIDEKQAFLEGYGLKQPRIVEMAPMIRALNVINYAPEIERMAEAKDFAMLEQYKTRLGGALDLYCL